MARANADAIAPPMLELAICCINMIIGKTSEMPARAFDPIRPTKWASTVAVTAIRTTLTMTLGAARRSNVLTIGPSSRSRVRATAGFAAGVTDAVWAIEKLVFVIAHSCPPMGVWSSAWTKPSWENRAAAIRARLAMIMRLSLGYANHHFSG